MILGYCDACEKEVEVIIQDEGIGPYEYWGAVGNDSQIIAVCTECDEEVEMPEAP